MTPPGYGIYELHRVRLCSKRLNCERLNCEHLHGERLNCLKNWSYMSEFMNLLALFSQVQWSIQVIWQQVADGQG